MCTGVRREDIKLSLINSKCAAMSSFFIPSLKNKAVLSASSDVLTTTKLLGMITPSRPNYEHFIQPFYGLLATQFKESCNTIKVKVFAQRIPTHDLPNSERLFKCHLRLYTNSTVGSTLASIITAHLLTYSSLPGELLVKQ